MSSIHSGQAEYLTSAEVMRMLPPDLISHRTLVRLGDAGVITTIRMPHGRRDRRYLRSSVEEYAAQIHEQRAS